MRLSLVKLPPLLFLLDPLGLVLGNETLEAALEVVFPAEEGADEVEDDAVESVSLLFVGKLLARSVLDDRLEHIATLGSQSHVAHLSTQEGAELLHQFCLLLGLNVEELKAFKDFGGDLDHLDLDAVLV